MKTKGFKRCIRGILTFLMALSLAAVAMPTELQAASADAKNISDESKKIENDIFWEDTDRNVLYSQGGGIFKFLLLVRRKV